MVLNTPNNPTGWTATPDQLAVILALCREHGVWLIADEVYSRLIYDGRVAAPSLLDIARPEDLVIVCNSFSMAWVMTGWRLGWMVVPEGSRDAVSEIVEVTHSGVAPFIQRAGIAALADTDTVARFRAHCARGREVAAAALNGVRFIPPDGAFYAFIGVAVAPGSPFGDTGEGYLRLSFAQSERLRVGLATHDPAPGVSKNS